LDLHLQVICFHEISLPTFVDQDFAIEVRILQSRKIRIGGRRYRNARTMLLSKLWRSQMSDTIDAKIVFLGAPSVGKTCIICQAISNNFNASMPSTIGACCAAKRVDLAQGRVNLRIWDTAGQERFRTLAPMYYRGAIVTILVYSAVDSDSLTQLDEWFEEVKEQTIEKPVVVVVANKMDLLKSGASMDPQGDLLAQRLGAFYYEVSAKTGSGIEELFAGIAEEAYKKIKGITENGLEITAALPPAPEPVKQKSNACC
jgi:small GTP-binding protein